MITKNRITAMTCVSRAAKRRRAARAGKAVRALSGLASLVVLAACSVFDARVPDPDKIVLGASDVVVIPKLSLKLDDYTCGTAAILMCEDYNSKLRCQCARPALGRR